MGEVEKSKSCAVNKFHVLSMNLMHLSFFRLGEIVISHLGIVHKRRHPPKGGGGRENDGA